MASRTATDSSAAYHGAGAAQPGKTLVRRLVASALLLAGLLTVVYSGLSMYIAVSLIYSAPHPPKGTPAGFGIKYTSVTFPAREDGYQINGWFMPGLLPGGKLTTQRIIIVAHGFRQNREDPAAGVLDFSRELVFNGFAVLSFDFRGAGTSEPAPFTFGYYEHRDVLGAVDFIHNGRLPYPELGRPKIIGGWGVSFGGANMILASAQEKAIAAVVIDCAYAEILPILEREVPREGHLPSFMVPGALKAVQALYGVDLYNVRPVDVIAQIAPRPLFLIQGLADKYVVPANHFELIQAARVTYGDKLQTWEVPDADHAQSFHTLRTQYVEKVVSFFNAALGPDSSAG
jgi:fermentation-respiration switch protein FrsA (DUF1100 family)